MPEVREFERRLPARQTIVVQGPVRVLKEKGEDGAGRDEKKHHFFASFRKNLEQGLYPPNAAAYCWFLNVIKAHH